MAEVLLLCYHTPVIVESTPFTLVLGVPAVCLELVLVGMVLYRGLHRRLPIFTAYVALVVVKEAVTSLVLYRFGLRSLPYYYAYWGSQGILVVLRGLVVAELLHAVLRPYRGVWTIARFALSVTAATLLLYAAVESAASAPQIGGFVLAADRGLEFAVVGALLALLAVCRYYEVGLDPLSAAIALGLAIYSSFAIMNNTVLFKFFSAYAQTWSIMRRVSYDAAVMIWLWPLLRPVPEQEAAPTLISASVYQQLVPEFSGRMRELNDRLLDILQR